jgi:hypothetical protein
MGGSGRRQETEQGNREQVIVGLWAAGDDD